MKISPELLDSNLILKKTKESKSKDEPLKEAIKKEAPREISHDTRLSLSPRAKDFQKAKALVLKEEDSSDREKKIAQLQKLIDEGKYEVDVNQVAENLLKEHLLMRE